MIFLGDEYSQVTGFISQIRLISNEREEEFNQLLKELITKKTVDENFKKELSDFFLLVFESAFFVSAFADNGINSNLGFFPELAKRIKHKLLPINSQENELSHFINFAFNKQMDYVWLQKINYSSWEAIIKLVDTNEFQNHSKKLAQQIYNAIIIDESLENIKPN